MKPKQVLFLVVALLLMVSLIAACGGGDNRSEQPSSGGASGQTEGAEPSESGETSESAEPTTAAEPTAAAEGEAAQPTEAVTDTMPSATSAVTETAAGGTGAGAEGAIRIAVVRGAMIDTMRKLAEKFQQENPGVTVQVEEEPEGGAFEALIAAGNQPDIIVASFGPQIGRLAAQQSAVPLEDMPGAADMLGGLEKATVEQLYGHTYYIPVGTDVTMMIYNKELFTEAGLDPEKPPATWDEFLAAAEKINNLPDREGGVKTQGTVFWNEALAWGGWYWNMLQPIYLNANQDQCQLLNRLGTDVVFDDPACGMEQFFQFATAAQKFAPPTMERNFFSRSIGMWPQYGYSWEPNLREALNQPMVIGQDVGIAPVPVPEAGQKSFTTYGGRGLMILKTSPERQNRAWTFIQFLMQPENNLVFLEELGYLPTITSLKADPYFQDPARQPFVEALATAVLPQQFAAADPVANAVLGVYQQAVVQGQMQPADATKAAAEQARAALQKAGAQ
jgi:multiple sugar transport system substrate-binding protein